MHEARQIHILIIITLHIDTELTEYGIRQIISSSGGGEGGVGGDIHSCLFFILSFWSVYLEEIKHCPVY